MADRRDRNERRYDGMAKSYRALINVGSLGSIRALHGALAERLDVAPGSTLVELGCGPGTVTAFLLEKLGPEGRYVGVDSSGEMIEQARKWAEDQGVTNAEFVKCAVLDYDFPTAPDAIVFSLSLSAMPEPKRCAEAALRALKPGGQMLILDSVFTGRRLTDLLIRAKSPAVGAVPEEFPMETLENGLGNLRIERHLLGVYSLITGRTER